MDNTSETDNIVQAVSRQLMEKLPGGWRILQRRKPASRASDRGVDVMIRAPNGKKGLLLIQAKTRVEPREAAMLKSDITADIGSPVLIAAPFLSARTQERLKSLGLAYADLTGNVHLNMSEPGLFIETSGAGHSPITAPRERKSLKGAKAGRLVRALCDFRTPVGLRALAKRAGIDAGYASRIIDYLDREALVARKKRGPIIEVDWPALIHRWSEEYSPLRPERVTWYLAPRGLAPVLEKLKGASARYAVSGSWAAAQFAPVAPTRLLLCYIQNVPEAARHLDLRQTETGANIALAIPFDSVIYERTMKKMGIQVVAPTQIAVDLLRSPGRGPNEAEALIDWMRENEHAWRT